jgi:hypothetical protein
MIGPGNQLKEEHGLFEIRTRVTFFLPVNNASEHKALAAVIRYLQGQREAELSVTGFTQSRTPDTVFVGYWWHDRWWREGVALFIVDYDAKEEDDRFAKGIERLQTEIAASYAHYGSAQQQIWLTAQRITLVV